MSKFQKFASLLVEAHMGLDGIIIPLVNVLYLTTEILEKYFFITTSYNNKNCKCSIEVPLRTELFRTQIKRGVHKKLIFFLIRPFNSRILIFDYPEQTFQVLKYR